MQKHSKYRGVTWNAGKKRWQAQTRYHGTVRFLGYFDDEFAAAVRHDIEVLLGRTSGESLNFKREVLEEWIRGACTAQKNGPPFLLEGGPESDPAAVSG